MSATLSPSHVVGIDLGGTHMQIGLVDPLNHIIARTRDLTMAEEGLDAVVARMAEGVRAVCQQAGIPIERVGGVGVGAPAPVDGDTGLILTAPNLRWVNVDLPALLSRHLPGCRFAVDNDVNAAGWAEAQIGAGVGSRFVLAVWIGTGIGGAVILDGKMVYGRFGTAGEIGQTVIDHRTAPARRILERNAARSAIIQDLQALMSTNHPTMLLDLTHGQVDSLNLHHVGEAIRAGDPLTLDVVNHALDLIGTTIANAVTLLSLDCVVVGGGIIETLGPLLMPRLRQSFDAAVFPDACKQCKIVETKLRENAGLLGAALLARGKLALPHA